MPAVCTLPVVLRMHATLRAPRSPPCCAPLPLQVWTVLYAAMGVAAHRVWLAGGGPLPLGLYATQLALNFAWTPLFFKAHNLKAAAVDITGASPLGRMHECEAGHAGVRSRPGPAAAPGPRPGCCCRALIAPC